MRHEATTVFEDYVRVHSIVDSVLERKLVWEPQNVKNLIELAVDWEVEFEVSVVLDYVRVLVLEIDSDFSVEIEIEIEVLSEIGIEIEEDEEEQFRRATSDVRDFDFDWGFGAGGGGITRGILGISRDLGGSREISEEETEGEGVGVI